MNTLTALSIITLSGVVTLLVGVRVAFGKGWRYEKTEVSK